MLTDEQFDLITAGIDGELTDAEAQQLRRLLDDSTEARVAYERLRSDSLRLQGLARLEPPADLLAAVMSRIAALKPPEPSTPVRPSVPSKTPRPRPQWIPIAVAASILIGIAGASFLYFSSNGDNASVAHISSVKPGFAGGGERQTNSDRLPEAPMPSERSARGMAQVAPAPVPVSENTVAIAPEPRAPDRDLIGAHPRAEFPNFDLVQLRLPFLESLADFDRDAIRQQLTHELESEPAFRIDLFARSTQRGVELFQKAARSSGLSIQVDSTSMGQLRKGQANSLVIYTDSLTAPELTVLLTRLNTEDARVSPRVFDAVHATPIAREDEIEIRRVLGRDPGLFKRPVAAPERRKGPPKGGSVSAGTADQIVDSLVAGKGRAAGTAVLMTWGPAQQRTPPAASAELKAYLAKRGERKPDAVPVIIVIRPGNG